MASQIGGDGMKKIGVHKIPDLMPLPWDVKAEKNMPLTKAEVDQEVAMMNAINKELRAKREKDSE